MRWLCVCPACAHAAAVGALIHRGLLVIGIVVALIYTLWPFLWLFVTSLKQPIEIFRTPPTLIPQHPTLGNYSVILNGYDPQSAIHYEVVAAFFHSCIVASPRP